MRSANARVEYIEILRRELMPIIIKNIVKDIIELFTYFNITKERRYAVYADLETLGHDHRRESYIQPTLIISHHPDNNLCKDTQSHSTLKRCRPVRNDAALRQQLSASA
jgi:hypothetical protein